MDGTGTVMRFHMREEKLVLQVLEAIRSLQTAESPVSVRAIAKTIGMTNSPLKHYPEVKLLLNEIKQKPKQAHN